MKNSSQNIIHNNSDLVIKNSTTKNIVTTDINILLNRVKLNEKKIFKKRLIFLCLLLTFISLITVFAIV